MFSGEEEKKNVEKKEFSKRAKLSVSQGLRWSSDQKPWCLECGKRHVTSCRRSAITCCKFEKIGH